MLNKTVASSKENDKGHTELSKYLDKVKFPDKLNVCIFL